MVRKPGDDESSGIHLPPRPAAEVVAPSSDQAPAEVVRDPSTEQIFDALLNVKERKAVMNPAPLESKPLGISRKPRPEAIWIVLCSVLGVIVLFWAVLKLANRWSEKRPEPISATPAGQPVFNLAPTGPGPTHLTPPPAFQFGQPPVPAPKFNFIRPGAPGMPGGSADAELDRRREEQRELDRQREAEADQREREQEWKAHDENGQPIQMDHGAPSGTSGVDLNSVPPAPAPAGPPPVNPAEVYN